MALYATRQLLGPHGEQVDANAPIPATWSVDDPFVAECVQYGWIVNSDEPTPAPTRGTPVPHAMTVDVGGVGGGGRRAHAQTEG